MSMEAIIYPFLVANILFFVYETDFFVQYAKLLRLNKPLGIDEYEKHTLTPVGGEDSYWEWLAFEKQTFLTKLLSCPLCTGFWLNVIAYFFHKEVGLLLVSLWLSLFLYLILKLVMKKSYE